MQVRELIALCDAGQLEFSSCIDAVDEDGYTPLHYACMLRVPGIIRALHEAAADVTAVDNYGFTPLHWAAMQLDEASLGVLCAHLFELDFYDREGRTPLYMLCVQGRNIHGQTDASVLRNCVATMLTRQPNVNIIDTRGLCVLHYLAASWHYEAMELMLKAGAEVNMRGGAGDNLAQPLHLA
ncbi:ankyrin repeat-containing domain protein, partial [Ochromonadaceae sp. CCMP2298]